MKKKIGELISAGGKAWVQLWDHREPATSLALVRICLGMVVLADLLMAWNLGLIESIWAPPPYGFANVDLIRPPWVVRQWGAGADAANITWGLSVAAAVGILTGTFTRLSCVAFVLLSAQLSYLAPDGDRGIDKLMRVTILVLAFSKSHGRWSVDALFWRLVRRPIGGASGLIPAWPRYLLFAQIVWMYFVAGWAKLGGGWNPFFGGLGALPRILSDPHMSKINADTAATFAPVFVALTIGTLLFEAGAPLWILSTYWNHTKERPGRLRRLSNLLRVRWLFLLAGVGFHVGIAITLRLGIFPWGCMALYPVVIAPHEWSAFWRWLRRLPPLPPASPHVENRVVPTAVNAGKNDEAESTAVDDHAENDEAAEAAMDAAPTANPDEPADKA